MRALLIAAAALLAVGVRADSAEIESGEAADVVVIEPSPVSVPQTSASYTFYPHSQQSFLDLFSSSSGGLFDPYSVHSSPAFYSIEPSAEDYASMPKYDSAADSSPTFYSGSTGNAKLVENNKKYFSAGYKRGFLKGYEKAKFEFDQKQQLARPSSFSPSSSLQQSQNQAFALRETSNDIRRQQALASSPIPFNQLQQQQQSGFQQQQDSPYQQGFSSQSPVGYLVGSPNLAAGHPIFLPVGSPSSGLAGPLSVPQFVSGIVPFAGVGPQPPSSAYPQSSYYGNALPIRQSQASFANGQSPQFSSTTGQFGNAGYSQPYPGSTYPATASQFSAAGSPYPGSGSQFSAAGSPYPGSGSQFSAAGSPYPGSGSQFSAAGSPYPGSGSQFSASGSPYPAAGSPYPTPGSPFSSSGSQLSSAGSPYTGPGAQFSASGSQFSSAGSPYPATGSQFSGTGPQIPGTNSQHLQGQPQQGTNSQFSNLQSGRPQNTQGSTGTIFSSQPSSFGVGAQKPEQIRATGSVSSSAQTATRK